MFHYCCLCISFTFILWCLLLHFCLVVYDVNEYITFVFVAFVYNFNVKWCKNKTARWFLIQKSLKAIMSSTEITGLTALLSTIALSAHSRKLTSLLIILSSLANKDFLDGPNPFSSDFKHIMFLSLYFKTK